VTTWQQWWLCMQTCCRCRQKNEARRSVCSQRCYHRRHSNEWRHRLHIGRLMCWPAVSTWKVFCLFRLELREIRKRSNFIRLFVCSVRRVQRHLKLSACKSQRGDDSETTCRLFQRLYAHFTLTFIVCMCVIAYFWFSMFRVVLRIYTSHISAISNLYFPF